MNYLAFTTSSLLPIRYNHGRLLLADADGIFTASWDEAAELIDYNGYGEYIFLVAPLDNLDLDLDTDNISHWRSSAATVIAGPWARDDVDGMRQAAEFILESHRQG